MENHIEVEETSRTRASRSLNCLIVIVILGILATVTVFAVTGITNKGKTSACQSDAKTIQTAEEAYSANNGVYTDQPAGLVDAGLLHAVSTKFTVALIGVAAARLASYTVTGVSTGDCRHQLLIRSADSRGAGPSGPAPLLLR